MGKLSRLVDAVRALSPHGQVTFKGAEEEPEGWVCVVHVGGIILYESPTGTTEEILDAAMVSLHAMSTRIQNALKL